MIRNDIPERSIEPPEEFYVIADCGHEVYEGESLFEWTNEDTGQIKQLCPDCFRAKVNALSLEELADLLRCDHSKVTPPPYGGRKYVFYRS